MKPAEFRNLANRLIDSEKNPAGFRSSISRAYFAAFLAARDFLNDAGITIPPVERGRLHIHVKDLFNGTGDAQIDELGTLLGNLRNERNTADYDLDDPSAENEANARLRSSEAGTINARLNTWGLSRG